MYDAASSSGNWFANSARQPKVLRDPAQARLTFGDQSTAVMDLFSVHRSCPPNTHVNFTADASAGSLTAANYLLIQLLAQTYGEQRNSHISIDTTRVILRIIVSILQSSLNNLGRFLHEFRKVWSGCESFPIIFGDLC